MMPFRLVVALVPVALVALAVLGCGTDEPTSVSDDRPSPPLVVPADRALLPPDWTTTPIDFDALEQQPQTSEVQAAEVEWTGWPLVLTNETGMAFRLVPRGEWTMGSPEEELGRGEEPQHEVHLKRPYYLAATEVTNAQFRAFRPEHSSGTSQSGASLDGDDQPAVNVSWEDAVAYAAWLTEQDPRFVYRLPTEAEWEWACRAGTTTPFSTGGRVTASQATLDCEEGRPPPGSSAVVGAHEPNAWGFFDLHGNAAEWCHDWFGDYPLWRVDNPQGASSGSERAARGGSWADPAQRARCAARTHLPADHRCATVGFRLAFSLSYGRTDLGAHTVVVKTVDPTVDDPADRLQPGWPMYMISVIDRLTDRVNQIADPRWTHLKQDSPITLKLAPGIYYVYCYRMEGEKTVRSIEMKFSVPGPAEILCPIPRRYQAHPQ